MKKLLSLLLALSLMLSLVCIPASANEEPDWSEYTAKIFTGGIAGRPCKLHEPLVYNCGLSVPGLPALIEGVITYDADGIALRKEAHTFNEDGMDFVLYPELYDVEYTAEAGKVSFRYTLKDGKGFDDLYALLDRQFAEAFREEQKLIVYEDESYRPTEPPKADRTEGSLHGFPLFSAAVEPIADGEYSMGFELLSVVNTDGIELYKNNEKTLNMQYGYQVSLLPGLRVDYPYGDADQDYEVTILDATRIQRFLVGLADMTTRVRRLADADRDGEVTILDATRIQRYLVGLSELA